MTGEMSASEVTKSNYPSLFKLRDKLRKEGIHCDALPWDKYQGPYLSCKGKKRFKVWFAPHEEVELSGMSKSGIPISRKEYVPKPEGTFLVEWREKGQLEQQEIYDYDARLIKEMLG